ncbi:Uncharacterised protein [Vibrio cholerae]|uniref:Uncharacterized protein n=1 Tax=Vibrio cholerae TaxID=666 RepID=A0A655Y6D0_VIBCL|nr:Uncharacterised protein [Vibrio cholerae]CSC29735.1 Uncharacterised protein [Vibrio cholerae]CSD19175.1 Uncharacterised protein [Vibrio cholerae]
MFFEKLRVTLHDREVIAAQFRRRHIPKSADDRFIPRFSDLIHITHGFHTLIEISQHTLFVGFKFDHLRLANRIRQ